MPPRPLSPEFRHELLDGVVKAMRREYKSNMTLSGDPRDNVYIITTVASGEKHAYALERTWKTGITTHEIESAFNNACGDPARAHEELRRTVENSMREDWRSHHINMMCAPSNFQPTASYDGPLPGMSIIGTHEKYYTKKPAA